MGQRGRPHKDGTPARPRIKVSSEESSSKDLTVRQETAAPAKRRNHNFFSGGVAEDPEANREVLRHALTVGIKAKEIKVDLSDPDAVSARVIEYFQFCLDDGSLATVAGLSSALGIDRTWLFRIHRREVKKPEAVVEELDWALRVINSQYEDAGNKGRVNPLFAIFSMRNNFGYTNQDDTSVVNEAAPDRTPEEIKQKYNKLLKE